MSATEASPLLAIDNLSFRYRRGKEPALRDISLELEAGEVLLVAGVPAHRT